jgi:hypothetical protein
MTPLKRYNYLNVLFRKFHLFFRSYFFCPLLNDMYVIRFKLINKLIKIHKLLLNIHKMFMNCYYTLDINFCHAMCIFKIMIFG